MGHAFKRIIVIDEVGLYAQHPGPAAKEMVKDYLMHLHMKIRPSRDKDHRHDGYHII